MNESKLSAAIIKYIASIGGHAVKIHSGAHQGRGCPDILASVDGQAIALETKLPKGGNPTPIQLWTMQKWRDAGAIVGCPRKVGDVRDMLKLRGLI